MQGLRRSFRTVPFPIANNDVSKVKNVLIKFAHPYPRRSRLNRRMAEAVRGLDGVVINDLYEHYPDFHIDVAREQALLRQADILVFQHPFYWYGAPALLKHWIDLVFERGYAHGSTGNVLEGKVCLSAVTTGLSEEQYSGDKAPSVPALLIPFEQTARHCGMTYWEPFVVYGAGQMEDDAPEIRAAAESYRALLVGLQEERHG